MDLEESEMELVIALALLIPAGCGIAILMRCLLWYVYRRTEENENDDNHHANNPDIDR